MADLSINEIGLLKGHSGGASVVRYDNNGDYCISGGSDKLLKLWNLESGKLIKEFDGHGWEILDITISHDRSRIASAGGDKSVFLWDIHEGKLGRKFAGHLQRINCVAFSTNGTVLASGSYDKSVRLWDLKSSAKMPIQTLDEARDSVSSLSFYQHEIIAASIDGMVRCYDIRTGGALCDTIGIPVTCVSENSDHNMYLIGCLDNSLKLFDRQNGKMLNEYVGFHNEKYKIFSTLSYDDGYVVSGSEDGRLVVWGILGDKPIYSAKAHKNLVTCVSYHPTKHQILTCSTDGLIKMWEIKT